MNTSGDPKVLVTRNLTKSVLCENFWLQTTLLHVVLNLLMFLEVDFVRLILLLFFMTSKVQILLKNTRSSCRPKKRSEEYITVRMI